MFEAMEVHAAIHAVLVPLIHVRRDGAGGTLDLGVHAMASRAITRALRLVYVRRAIPWDRRERVWEASTIHVLPRRVLGHLPKPVMM